jgi:prefoldin subunit 5
MAMWPWQLDEQLAALQIQINTLNKEVKRIMTAQSDVDAAVAAHQAVTADLTSAVTTIQAEIAALGTPVDTSALDTAVTALQAADAAVDALESAPVVTPPAS